MLALISASSGFRSWTQPERGRTRHYARLANNFNLFKSITLDHALYILHCTVISHAWLFPLHTTHRCSPLPHVHDDRLWHRIPDPWPFTPLPDSKCPGVSCVSEDKSVDNRKYFTLQDVFNSSLKPKSYSLIWISGLSGTLSGQDADLASYSHPNSFILHCYSFTIIHLTLIDVYGTGSLLNIYQVTAVTTTQSTPQGFDGWNESLIIKKTKHLNTG